MVYIYLNVMVKQSLTQTSTISWFTE